MWPSSCPVRAGASSERRHVPLPTPAAVTVLARARSPCKTRTKPVLLASASPQPPSPSIIGHRFRSVSNGKYLNGAGKPLTIIIFERWQALLVFKFTHFKGKVSSARGQLGTRSDACPGGAVSLGMSCCDNQNSFLKCRSRICITKLKWPLKKKKRKKQREREGPWDRSDCQSPICLHTRNALLFW